MLSITNPHVEETRKSNLPPLKSRRAQGREDRRVAIPATDGFSTDDYVESVYATLDRPRYRSSKRARTGTSSRAAVILFTVLLAAAWYAYPQFRERVRQVGRAAGIEISVGHFRSGDVLAE